MLTLVARIQLEAAADHVEVLAHEADPVRAVVELIWNGLDADAHTVTVSLRRNELEGVDGVIVADDGHGMTPGEARSAFRWIGGSWKRTALRSKGEGRPLHGKSGQGRLRAFALGTTLRWVTVADEIGGRRLLTAVTAQSDSRNDVEISEPAQSAEPTGTYFEAMGKDNLDRLATDRTLNKVSSALAPYLIARPTVEVIYDGRRVEPSDNIERDVTIELVWAHEDATNEASLRIIEWKKATERAIHLCDAEGIPVEDLPDAPAPDFRYSAYVLWEHMPHHRGESALVGLEQEPSLVGSLVASVTAKLTDYFEDRRAEKRREVVQGWKQQGTYPYPGEPQTEQEKIERATFDVVATSVNRHVPKQKGQQKLTLGLLKQTLQHRPQDVSLLLDQFVGLPDDEKDRLRQLLERSHLSRIIQATASVTDRVDFLAALRRMVFDPEANGMVKERAHLHRMLERELWVFGEQYNMMLSERGLTHALRQHLTMLGRDSNEIDPVRLTDGSTGRLDLMLSARAREHDRLRHLVVELKAPKVVAHEEQANQIKKYARAVVADPQFADLSTDWDFFLVIADMDADVQKDVTQSGRTRGILDQSVIDPTSPVNYRVWIKRWSEILDEAEKRLQYFQESLRHDPTIEDVKSYLRRNHRDVLPDGLFVNPQDDEDLLELVSK
jgi:hypothetical protein